MSALPWSISKGGTETANSANALPKGYEVFSGLRALLFQTEAALNMFGHAYWMREQSPQYVNQLRWLKPSSIVPKFNERDGLIGFERRGLKVKTPMLTTDELVYFWAPNVTGEVGPGVAPAQAALTSASLLKNSESFITNFFAKGAVPLVLLTVDGEPMDSELRRLEQWWKRILRGVSSAFETVAVRASVKPQIITPPIKDLAMKEITDTNRENVATALGVPYSLIFSNAANYATAKQDDLNFYTKTILPSAVIIAETLNVQLFEPNGLHFSFTPEDMEIFQEIESHKADKLMMLFNAGIMTRAEVREQMGIDPDVIGEDEPAPEPEPMSVDNMAQMTARAWRKKSLKALTSGKLADVPFETDAIEASDQAHIRLALAVASSVEDVRRAFAQLI